MSKINYHHIYILQITHCHNKWSQQVNSKKKINCYGEDDNWQSDYIIMITQSIWSENNDKIKSLIIW